MQDSLFIQQMLVVGNEARQKVKDEFSIITTEQLNWKPSEESWSIGQCLDHLVVSDSLYFPSLKKITEGSYKMRNWEKRNPLSGFFGRMLVSQVQEKVGKKLKAPKVLKPSSSKIDASIIEHFHKHLDTLFDHISAAGKIDLDKTRITSPVSKLITYSLRHAITLIIQHEHRHINQAIRVKAKHDFPR